MKAKTEDRITSIKRHGITAQGRNELLRHLDGKRLTQRQAIKAKCYECCGYYADGKNDCVIPDCPLYPLMPYGTARKKALQSSST